MNRNTAPNFDAAERPQPRPRDDGAGRDRTSRPAIVPHQREAAAGTARSRGSRPAASGGDLIERLEAEWPLLASGPLQQRLRIWSEEEPALAGFATPQQLLRQLRSLRGRPRAEDAILAALVRQAQADPLAARVVLQALLPGLKALAGRLLLEASERDELWSALLAHCWERIRSYPLDRRPTRVAANVLLDTLKRASRELTGRRRDRDQLTDDASRNAEARVSADVERLLERAVAAAAISAAEAELILRTRIDGDDLGAVAAELGVAYHTLTVRRLRAEKRLLLFLGYRAVTFRGRRGPLSSARAVGAGLTGSAGRGADTHQHAKEVNGPA